MEPHDEIRRSLRGVAAALGQERLAEVPEFLGFEPVNAEAIAQELELYVRAAEAGQRGEPAAKAHPPDAIETAIVAAIQEKAQAGALAYQAHLAQHDDGIRRTFLTDADDLEIEASCRSLVEEVDRRVRDLQTRLLESWRDLVQDVETEFQEFRERNDIERPPRLVTNGEKFVRVVALAGLVASGVYAHGKVLGASNLDPGRVLPAVLWSLFNVMSAAWYGRTGFGGLIGRGFMSKLRGVGSSLLLLACTLGVQLVAAHHAELALGQQGDPSLRSVWEHLTLGVFGLEATRAWFVAGLGAGCSVLAVFAAAGMDDLYPGYGAIGRRRVAAMEAYGIESKRCSEAQTALRITADEDLRASIEAVQSREFQASAAAEARRSFHDEYREFLAQLAAAHDHLCHRYRQINAAVQNGRVPTYFHREIEWPRCLVDPGLADPPQPRHAWQQPIERLQRHAESVAALFADARPRESVAETVLPEPLEEGIEVGV